MERIKKIREEKNLSQKDLAILLHIDRSTYSSYETMRDMMPLKYINTICNYFNMSIDYCFSLTDIFEYKNSRKETSRQLFRIRIKELRKKYNLTQNDIAKILNINRSTWTGYESGKYRIPTLYLYDIAKRFNTSMDYLLGKVDQNYL